MGFVFKKKKRGDKHVDTDNYNRLGIKVQKLKFLVVNEKHFQVDESSETISLMGVGNNTPKRFQALTCNDAGELQWDWVRAHGGEETT